MDWNDTNDGQPRSREAISHDIEIIDIDSSPSPAASDVTIEYDVESSETQLSKMNGSRNECVTVLDNDVDVIVPAKPKKSYLEEALERHMKKLASINEKEQLLYSNIANDVTSQVQNIACKRSSENVEDQPKKKTKRPETAEDKERRKLESARAREEKALEKERLKQEKANLAALNRNMKPEETIKNIRVLVDVNVINLDIGATILPTLQKENIAYRVENLGDPGVTWVHVQGEHVENKNDVLKIIMWSQLVEWVDSQKLLRKVNAWKLTAKHARLTLVILGLEKYWAYQTNSRNRNLKAAVTCSQSARGHKKSEAEYEAAPYVSQDQVESALIEIQLLADCTHRNIEKGEDLANLIFQWTKSISQIEMKRAQYNKEKDTLSWFAKADGKNCVKVDKNGNGLKEVWQQQICQFNSIGLEVAQAIVCKYGSPQELLSAYSRCSGEAEATGLLADIPVRREAGILSSTRRVGPELSLKIHRFLTSTQPDVHV